MDPSLSERDVWSLCNDATKAIHELLTSIFEPLKNIRKGPESDSKSDFLHGQILFTSLKMKALRQCLQETEYQEFRSNREALGEHTRRLSYAPDSEESPQRLPNEIIAHIFSLAFNNDHMLGSCDAGINGLTLGYFDAFDPEPGLKQLILSSMTFRFPGPSYERYPADDTVKELFEKSSPSKLAVKAYHKSKSNSIALQYQDRWRSLSVEKYESWEAISILKEHLHILPQLTHLKFVTLDAFSKKRHLELPDLQVEGRSLNLISAHVSRDRLADFVRPGYFRNIRDLTVSLSLSRYDSVSSLLDTLLSELPSLVRLTNLTLDLGYTSPTSRKHRAIEDEKPVEVASLKVLHIEGCLAPYTIAMQIVTVFASTNLEEFSLTQAIECREEKLWTEQETESFYNKLHVCFPHLSNIESSIRLDTVVRILSTPSESGNIWLLPRLHTLRLAQQIVNPTLLVDMLRARQSLNAQEAGVVPINFLKLAITYPGDMVGSDRSYNQLGDDWIALYEISKWVPNVVRLPLDACRYFDDDPVGNDKTVFDCNGSVSDESWYVSD